MPNIAPLAPGPFERLRSGYGSGPFQQLMMNLSLTPGPQSLFEAETYPLVSRALDQISQASKRVSPEFYENSLANVFSTLRNYQQAIDREVATANPVRTGLRSPTRQELLNLRPGTRVKDLLVSELKAGGREAKLADPNLRSGDVFSKLMFSPGNIKDTLRYLERELLPAIYGAKR